MIEEENKASKRQSSSDRWMEESRKKKSSSALDTRSKIDQTQGRASRAIDRAPAPERPRLRYDLRNRRPGSPCVYVKPPPHRKGHAWSYGQITRLVEPRSCVIRTSSGEVRRNRAQVRMAAPPPPPVTVSTPAITSTSATPVSSQSALPAPVPQFPSAKSATSQFPLATSASSNPAVQPTVSSRCDPPHEAQTPQSSLQSSVCASGDSSQKSLSQMAPYKTRSGRVVKSPKVFDPSDNV